MKFELIHQSKKSEARVGRIHTAHGIINTPNFVAVGTNGTIKGLDNKMLKEIELELMFCNTYHLLLQPGTELIKRAGGLHKFIQRDLPIITDSGGFQVFSLAYGSVANEIKSKGMKKQDGHVLKINEDGVIFRSYRDGQKVHLSPESSVIAQKNLGADIIIPFDELPPYHMPRDKLIESLDRTHRWEKRSLDQHKSNEMGQAMYAVVHGGVDRELRKKSAQTLGKMPFDGFAIGGSLGRSRQEMIPMLADLMPHIPKERPNHLLGIGDIPSIEECIPLGLDTFDSSYPTKAARHATLLTKEGSIKATKKIYENVLLPIEKDCTCYTCRNYSIAYLNHLFKAKESTAHTLASVHNLHFLVQYMKRKRELILEDRI
jgi:queuine tRNA-ribosyltransferase